MTSSPAFACERRGRGGERSVRGWAGGARSAACGRARTRRVPALRCGGPAQRAGERRRTRTGPPLNQKIRRSLPAFLRGLTSRKLAGGRGVRREGGREGGRRRRCGWVTCRGRGEGGTWAVSEASAGELREGSSGRRESLPEERGEGGGREGGTARRGSAWGACAPARLGSAQSTPGRRDEQQVDPRPAGGSAPPCSLGSQTGSPA